MINPASNLKIIGKCLDQPLLVSKISNTLPKVLIGGGAAFGLYNTIQAPEGERKKAFIKNFLVLSFTIGSALAATKGINFIKRANGKPLLEGLVHTKSPKVLQKELSSIVDNFIKHNKVDRETFKILQKAKEKALSFSEMKILLNKLGSGKKANSFMSKLVPNPENLSSSKIWGEIKKLTALGAIPIIGGITGGTVADTVVKDDWKENFSNKLKEGFYQFTANIFLCNVGAGAALMALEKLGIRSKSSRAAGMVAGIMTVGVLGGSVIANFFAKNLINPIFDHGPAGYCKKLASGKLNNGRGINCKNLNSERKPEAIDVMLHVDDFATVGVLSGLRWIEPALPILYSISGYRAGIGYRNGKKHNHPYKHHINGNNIDLKSSIINYNKPNRANIRHHHVNLIKLESPFKRFEKFQLNTK